VLKRNCAGRVAAARVGVRESDSNFAIAARSEELVELEVGHVGRLYWWCPVTGNGSVLVRGWVGHSATRSADCTHGSLRLPLPWSWALNSVIPLGTD
jgi:hypothetical protein